jgi:hypothetical protein
VFPTRRPTTHHPHLVDVWRDRLAADAHARAVDEVAVLSERQPPDDDALLARDDMQAAARAAEHAGEVVEHGVALPLILEELDVGVEEVALGDVDTLVCVFLCFGFGLVVGGLFVFFCVCFWFLGGIR